MQSPRSSCVSRLHWTFDDLVPVLRRRGLLRTGFGNGGLRENLFDF
ncbi:MAG: hypothetical protein ACRYF3_15985 [Janthinobacterium lividum]